jgi:NAD+ diphosphatase
MVGLILEADGEDISVDESELETARWFTRAEIASMMAGTNPEVYPPMHFAIAHHVIKAWLERG